MVISGRLDESCLLNLNSKDQIVEDKIVGVWFLSGTIRRTDSDVALLRTTFNSRVKFNWWENSGGK